MITQCANSTCRARFDYHVGGRFFRFHLTEIDVPVFPDATHNRHNVVHYWLSHLLEDVHSGSRSHRRSCPASRVAEL